MAGTLALGVALIAAPVASAAPNERIASYDVSVTIASNGSAHVTEKIAYDFGTNERHGITRGLSGRKLAGPAKATSPDGAPTTVTMGSTYIKVGDPAVTVTGVHTYVLDYDVLDAVSLVNSDASVRWEVADDSWNVPMSSVTATITAPSAAKLSYCYLRRVDCRSGVATVDGAVLRVQLNALSAKETLTVKATFSSAGMTLTRRATPTYTSPSYTAPTYTTSTRAAASSDSSSRSSGGVVFGWLFGLGILGGFIALIAALSKSGRGRGGQRSGGYRSHGSTGWYGGSSYDSSSSSSSSYDSSSSSSSYDSGSSGSSSSDSGSSGSW
nr:hypothetical protein [Kibdelosporangium sp. MJ126-NF4]CTQ90210.1 hypothetical protein [Kibdelosporangium sp. MJ126-NF4]